MRLLDTESRTLLEFYDNEIPEYAILSHRWQKQEVTFKDMCDGVQQSRKGYAKLKSCCELAHQRGMAYVWIDTCCIDKSSSAELTESINSMYQWYAKARECYAYLSDVDIQDLDTTESHEKLAASAWFTRGWTLQELIAPSQVIFYNCHWVEFGTKASMQSTLSQITSVDVDVLTGASPPSSRSVAQRMSWASKRVTTRIEDVAYCLLGIFEVNMPLLYGEGSRAFFRLQRKIIKQYDDQTIFAWTDGKKHKPVFAPSPACFHGLQTLACIYPTNDTREGYTLANSGLSIQVMLIPYGMSKFLAPLSCGYVNSNHDKVPSQSLRKYKRACIVLQQIQNANHFVRVSHLDRDLEIRDADDIASIRDQLGLKPRRIFIQQHVPTALPEPLFNGFEFSFNHQYLFGKSKFPSSSDVLCSNLWTSSRSIFELVSGEHRAAGVFRLSGVSNPGETVLMHLGFDLDFVPVCTITSVDFRHDNPAFDADLSKVHESAVDGLLDLNLLLSKVDAKQRPAPAGRSNTILAFRGEHQSSAEVICRRLALKLTFRVQFSETLESSVWHVAFDHIQHNEVKALSNIPQHVHVNLSPNLWVTPVYDELDLDHTRYNNAYWNAVFSADGEDGNDEDARIDKPFLDQLR